MELVKEVETKYHFNAVNLSMEPLTLVCYYYCILSILYHKNLMCTPAGSYSIENDIHFTSYHERGTAVVQ